MFSAFKQAFNASKQYVADDLKLQYMEMTKNEDKGFRFLVELVSTACTMSCIIMCMKDCL